MLGIWIPCNLLTECRFLLFFEFVEGGGKFGILFLVLETSVLVSQSCFVDPESAASHRQNRRFLVEVVANLVF